MAPKSKNANKIRVTVAAQRDTKQRATPVATKSKERRPIGMGPRVVDRNDYLSSLLNPRLSKNLNIGVPSGTLTSTVFQTKKVISVTVDPVGTASYCFMPAVVAGGLKIGSNLNGALTTMAGSAGTDLSASNFTAAGYAPATVFDTISSLDKSDITSSASAIRPVSMQVDWIPTGAALVESGSLSVRLCNRSDIPASPDTTSSGTSGTLKYGRGPGSADVIKSDDRASEIRATETVSAFWSPEDELDYQYRPVLYNNVGGRAQAGVVAVTGWKTGYWASTSAGNPIDDCLLPYQPEETSPLAGVADYTDMKDQGYPYIQMTFTGAQAAAGVTTTIGECIVYTNWEMITDGTRVIDLSTPRVSNPLELAQAENVVSMVPMITVPSQPANPLTLIHEAVTSAPEHLYDSSKSRKQSIEGTSWLPSLVKSVGSVGGLIAGAIPGYGAIAGPLVTAGSSLIASLLE